MKGEAKGKHDPVTRDDWERSKDGGDGCNVEGLRRKGRNDKERLRM